MAPMRPARWTAWIQSTPHAHHWASPALGTPPAQACCILNYMTPLTVPVYACWPCLAVILRFRRVPWDTWDDICTSGNIICSAPLSKNKPLCNHPDWPRLCPTPLLRSGHIFIPGLCPSSILITTTGT
ncbi:hypothetical protein PHLGIDRAFT_378675 [Phlebiopsis gigantea 11061_1 CR5-6]|uniref:Uncharacterized protein n=1 Tax=Phlebiopsis gigantea (strain 11061_1 CR5-6) TaxID=745531 RepID=A0A0C3S0M4_PHLG1|nr:hypothetical protein PHLGIDRAFT_378675 [Phlebiopsis gigantea 11061_1 CR5-6]